MISRSSSLHRSTSSTSSNKSIEKSAGDTGTAGNVTGGGRSSSIPQLPDEIILKIFGKLHDHIATSYSQAFRIKLSYIVLNRRYYNLLRPLWTSSFFPFSNEDRKLAELLSHHHTRQNVRDLKLRDCFALVQGHFAILSKLSNIRRVWLSLIDGDTLPNYILSFLKGLKELSDLSINGVHPVSLDRSAPVLASVAPRLVSLKIDFSAESDLFTLLSDCPTSLESLEIVIASVRCPAPHIFGYLPISTVPKTTIEVDWGEGGLPKETRLCSLVERALYPNAFDIPYQDMAEPEVLPLRELNFRFEIAADSEDEFDSHDLNELLKLLGSTQVRSLGLLLAESGLWSRPSPGIRVDSLQELRLESGANIRIEENYSFIWRLMKCCPSLRHFALVGFSLSESRCVLAVEIAALDEVDLSLTFPELAGLVVYAQRKTSIPSFVYQDLIRDSKVVWHRHEAEEEFQKDSYSAKLYS